MALRAGPLSGRRLACWKRGDVGVRTVIVLNTRTYVG